MGSPFSFRGHNVHYFSLVILFRHLGNEYLNQDQGWYMYPIRHQIAIVVWVKISSHMNITQYNISWEKDWDWQWDRVCECVCVCVSVWGGGDKDVKVHCLKKKSL